MWSMSSSHLHALDSAERGSCWHIFSRESDSTITNVRSLVCPSVRHKSKPLNSLKSSYCIIHPSSFIILHSSFITLHSSFITLHSSFLHFATFKLFSLLWKILFYMQVNNWEVELLHGSQKPSVSLHNSKYKIKTCMILISLINCQ